MKVLVTGGAGFIGSHIVDQLVFAGHQVVVIDDLSTGSKDHLNSKAVFIQMNILDDGMLEVFEREKFDGVCHLAAQTVVQSSLERPDADARLNVLGTLQVLEGCRRTGVGRIIFASSAAVYGDVSELPVAEEAPKQPTSFYGLSKLTAEKYIQMYNNLYGLHYVILRYANVYGERQGDRGEGGVVSIFANGMHGGRSLTIFGDGKQTRDFVYVGDVAAANVRALICPNSDRVLNVGTQTETSVNRLAAVLSSIADYRTPIQYQSARPGDILNSMLRNSEARGFLEWEPVTGLEAGLARTYQAMRR